ncbi:MAG: tRNA preQ1(34) S-adenosylmethionine ribosyltransferase-isomerase QueA [Candidatus Gracilibacteria bacterium]
MFKTEDFNYSLPKRFIAQNPVSPRDGSKLLVFDAQKNAICHKKFFKISDFLKKGDVLVVNVSKVIPARIVFHEGSSEREIFLLKDCDNNCYQAMVRPGKLFKIGKSFKISVGVECVVKEILDDGTRIIEFILKDKRRKIAKMIAEIGKIPFPPYVGETSARPDQYQTVYAKTDGSVAAPTAGLHFTPSLIKKLKNKGVEVEEVLLHVSRGTFLPVKSEYVHEHKMHSECFTLDKKTAENLNRAKKEGKRIIAVGTTTVRVLESCYDLERGFVSQSGETDIFIYPGKYEWKIVDALITNYHLPKSTLLMLVSSFLESKGVKKSVEKLMDLYEIAKKEDYRFYSFGDAMFLF